MKKLQFLPLLISVALFLAACSSDDDPTPYTPTNKTTTTTNNNRNIVSGDYPSEITRLEFPHVTNNGHSLVVVHYAAEDTKGNSAVNYSIEWDYQIHAQRWSCFQMYKNNAINNGVGRSVNTQQEGYPNDEDLPSQYQFTKDPYWNTGYDHGHIIASYDRQNTAEANRQTFFLTNMQPQVNGFNAKVWANMEAKVRAWNTDNFRDTLYVCRGGTIDDSNQIITYLGSGDNKIPVPKYFFMAVLCKNSNGYKALGFWIEHKGNTATDLTPYIVNIATLEQNTGLDFFCNLPDDIEKTVENASVDNIKKSFGFK